MTDVASMRSRFRQLQHSPTLRLSLPGVLVLIACWVAIFFSIDHRSIFEDGYAFMQSLGREALEDRPWSAIGVLHIQPPGLSVLHAIDLVVTPISHALLIGLYLFMAIGSLVMIVDALLLLECPSWVSRFGGMVFACLPAYLQAQLLVVDPVLRGPQLLLGLLELAGVCALPALEGGVGVDPLGHGPLVEELLAQLFEGLEPACMNRCIVHEHE